MHLARILRYLGPFVTTLAVLALVVATFATSHLWVPSADQHEGLAGWVQALGSIFAIFASVGIAIWIDQGAVRRSENAAKLARRRFINFSVEALGRVREQIEALRSEYNASGTVERWRFNQANFKLDGYRRTFEDLMVQSPDSEVYSILRDAFQLCLFISSGCRSIGDKDGSISYVRVQDFQDVLGPAATDADELVGRLKRLDQTTPI